MQFDHAKRREFIALLGSTAAWPLTVVAQTPAKVARIGFLRYASPHERQFNVFREQLGVLGYIEDRNLVIVQRYAGGALDRLSGLAAELVRSNMDVIVVDGSATAKVAQAATTSIPIVFTIVTDPVAEGLVASLARPRSNLTGLTMSVGYKLAGKRIELLKGIKPDLSRLAVLTQPDNPTARPYLQDIEAAGRLLGISVRAFDVRSAADIAPAFAAMMEWRANGLTTHADALLFSQREQIIKLALESGLAAVHPEAEYPEAGGLLSYGPSYPDLFRRAATYVDKILKGSKPADLPVEQPTKVELVINLKTARALGLTVSREFLLRADEIIE